MRKTARQDPFKIALGISFTAYVILALTRQAGDATAWILMLAAGASALVLLLAIAARARLRRGEWKRHPERPGG